jgi:predicted  nucleic acid-binding Zn-ribbon protein
MSRSAWRARATISSSRGTPRRLARDLLHDRDGTLDHERDRIGVGAHAVACRPRRGQGRPAEGTSSKMTPREHDEQRSPTTCQRCGHSASDHDMGLLCGVVHCGCRVFARARREKPERPEKKPDPPAEQPSRVLPMQLEVGDRVVGEKGECEVVDRPHTTAGGKIAHARVRKVGQSEVTEIRSWGAHERVTVKRAAAEDRNH